MTQRLASAAGGQSFQALDETDNERHSCYMSTAQSTQSTPSMQLGIQSASFSLYFGLYSIRCTVVACPAWRDRITITSSQKCINFSSIGLNVFRPSVHSNEKVTSALCFHFAFSYFFLFYTFSPKPDSEPGPKLEKRTISVWKQEI